MAQPVVMPKQGMTMTEGTVTEWFVKDGDTVAVGDRLYAFETEKIAYDVTADGGGIIRILAPVDTTLPAGGIAAYLLASGEALPAGAAVAAAPAAAPTPAPSASAAKASAAPSAASAAPASEGAVKASPAAKKLAGEHGIDLSALRGSGPGGRIVVEDVEAAIAAKTAAPAGAAPRTAPAAAPVRDIPYKGMRRAVGGRMLESLQTSAQLTMTMDVDMTDAVKLRRDLVSAWEPEGVRITYTHMVVKAAALALREFPRVNVALDKSGETVQVLPEVNVGLAVALDEGLIVPVIRHADTKALKEIAKESAILSDKARTGKMTPDDLTGGTFTVTALGMYDIDAFTPILNPPQAAILGVGRVADRPVFVGYAGLQIERRSFLTVSLTIDHRILDGAPGAQYMQILRRYLEHPYRLLTDI